MIVDRKEGVDLIPIVDSKMKFVVFAFAIILLLGYSPSSLANEIKSLKVLAIGNSYSTDGLQHVWQIAEDAGYEEIILANLYIGSSGLELHWRNAQEDRDAYGYHKNTSGNWQQTPNKSIKYGIQDENWDVITIHERGMYSGTPEEILKDDRLKNLVNYIHEHKLNPKTKVIWHMTWAYEEGRGVATLENTYAGNQMAMYEAIVNAIETAIIPEEGFDYFIPVGTALQNVRTSYIGDSVTRDGHHLSHNLGRYVAGLTWFHKITNEPIDELTWVPNQVDVNQSALAIAKEAVQAAVANPLEITQSKYTERPVNQRSDFDYSNYELFDWEPIGNSYWNSRNSNGLHASLITEENSTGVNLKYFIGSGRMFTKEELPPGTIIEIDQGYSYRPEGWVDLERQASREGHSNEYRLIVTDEWWGNYQYRAFSVSVFGNQTDISNRIDEVSHAFRIYVPKQEQ